MSPASVTTERKETLEGIEQVLERTVSVRDVGVTGPRSWPVLSIPISGSVIRKLGEVVRGRQRLWGLLLLYGHHQVRGRGGGWRVELVGGGGGGLALGSGSVELIGTG